MAKTAAKKKRGRPPKARQTYLPDMEPPSIPEIDMAAESYLEARNSRQEMTEEEVKRKEALKELMKKHGLQAYDFGSYTVTRTAEVIENVKVKRKKAEANGDEDGDDEE